MFPVPSFDLHDWISYHQEGPFLSCSDIELANMSELAQIKYLKDELNLMNNKLTECIRYIDTLQNQMSYAIEHFCQINDATMEVVKEHTKKAHAMLIVGNKEASNESNIS